MGLAGAGEIEKLADNLRHLVRLGLDGLCAAGNLLRAELPRADQPGAAGNDAQRSAQLVGDPRGHAAHRLQPVRMAKLLQGGDAGGRLLANPPLRLRQLVAHQVQAFAKFRQLVVRAQADRSFQISRGNQPRLLHQPPQRLSHQADAQRGGQEAAEQCHAADQERRPLDDVPLAVLQLAHRVCELQAAAPLGGQRHGPVDVQLRRAVRVERFDRQVLFDGHGRQLFGGDRGAIRIARWGVKPHPADAEFMPLTLIHPADHLEHALVSAAAPGVGQHVLHGAAERFGLDARRVLENADFAADRVVAVDRRQQDVAERERQNELQRESHVFLSRGRKPSRPGRGAFFPSGASWGAWLGQPARPWAKRPPPQGIVHLSVPGA